ncbi:MAG: hypothetical protein GX456_15380 [Verrucomicrobia bacterium]|nr:hypothetical protein [Verrucomicrobiota bacterium]
MSSVHGSLVARGARMIPPAALMGLFLGLLTVLPSAFGEDRRFGDDMVGDFLAPPVSARPWVYWFFMDGNLSREGITADLEAMHRAGVGGCIIMEVDVGVPRGPVRFMSDEWRELFRHAVREAERLGIQLTLNAGPGWTGSGGPWVKPEQSMQHLVASETNVVGPAVIDWVLPRPIPRPPFFGEGGLPSELEKARKEFCLDVAVLAFPMPKGGGRILDIEEKALYIRAPYSSQPGVRPYFLSSAEYPALSSDECVDRKRIVDLTSRLSADGRLNWSVPEGHWTILRFGRTSTGQNTRPAPQPGLGLESDKFDRAALDAHFGAFVGKLLEVVGSPNKHGAGWTMLHIDSWEMGAQNWTARFREEFQRRRGYDPLPYLPVMTGRVVDGLEVSERFLWDLRQTAQELVIENHARRLRELAHKHGMGLSIEPYDMNPCADLSLGGEADVPMCEFWARGYGFKTEFSVFEATSIAHTQGRPVVAAESFTSDDRERWLLYPGAMKAQADWALCAGVNRIVFHRYQHQPWLDRWPGMTMGPYGAHWERTQTWWEMVPAFHNYLARCQYLLQKGRCVADICYLASEGAPHVFRPPASALWGDLPYRRGYNFDGCAPELVIERMTVNEGRLELPGGASYKLLVLPDCDTMTPRLLKKVRDLVEAGAMVLGRPPRKSPSLKDYPRCDVEVKKLADELWGGDVAPAELVGRQFGKGRVYWGGSVGKRTDSADLALPPVGKARWIWHAEGNPALAAPVERRYFRTVFDIERSHGINSAKMAVTADNSFELFVNGSSVGTGDNFHQTYLFEVTNALRPGRNVLAVAAENGGDTPNPAGLVAALAVRYDDGGTQIMITDGNWKSSAVAEEGWTSELFSGAGWAPVAELGPFDMSPWNKKPTDFVPDRDLYLDYEVAARILGENGLEPDFEADPRLGYTHRRDGDCDIYFVVNPESAPVVARATFRVHGKQPELWDPLTGQCKDLRGSFENSGRTTVTLQFEPNQSLFVVFRKPAKGGSGDQTGFTELKPVADLAGPWEVSFQPGRGAPDRILIDRLMNLAEHTDSRVRHFSGIASYRKSFEWNPSETARADRGAKVWLDLGRVEVIAAVNLNGQELHIAWTRPFRVEVSRAIRVGRNDLEVRVANLWPNCLIADSALPQDQRLTWTTWNPFKPGDPLPASGLVGPVTVLVEIPSR